MIALIRYISSSIADGLRRITVSRYGKYDTCETTEIAPPGYDAQPVPGQQGIYSDTSAYDTTIVFGYVNTNQKAAEGERRIYSTDNNGVLQYNVWLRNTGEVLLGESDNPEDYTNNLVKYNQLSTSLDNEAGQINTNFTQIATAIATLASALGLPPTPPLYTPTTVAADITTSKADKIKTTS